jgi:hypothetical protein
MAMNEIHPIYLILIFIAGWIVISCLISLLGGWFWLAKRFPLHNGTGNVIKSFTRRSLNLNYLCGYSSCVNIKITDNGLILKTSLLFSVLHSPIFLPWPSISDSEYKKGLFKRVKFHVGKNRLVFYGKVAKMVQKVIQSKQEERNSIT